MGKSDIQEIRDKEKRITLIFQSILLKVAAEYGRGTITMGILNQKKEKKYYVTRGN